MFRLKGKTLLTILSLMLISLLVVGCAGPSEPSDGNNNNNNNGGNGDDSLSHLPKVTIELAIHPLPLYQQAMRAFIDYVELNSNGRISVSTFTFPELGSETEIVEMVSYGEIHMASAVTDGPMSTMMPSSQATSLPFLIQDGVILQKLMDGPFFYTHQQKLLEESGNTIRPLAFTTSSIRHFYSTKGPIRTPQDLTDNRIKLRVMEAPFYIALWSGLGTETIGLPANERYQALQTGMIDATEGALMSAWEAGLMEVSSHVTLTSHTFGVNALIINEEFFQGLPIEYKRIIVEGSMRAAQVDNGYIPLSDSQALELMRNAGIEITVPTPNELAQWREIAFPIGRQFLEAQIDSDYLQELIDEVARIEAEIAEKADKIMGN